MGYCTECGAQYKDGSLFCTSCGAPIKSAGSTAAPEVKEIQPANGESASEGYQDSYQPGGFQSSYQQDGSYQQNQYQNGYQPGGFQGGYQQNEYQGGYHHNEYRGSYQQNDYQGGYQPGGFTNEYQPPYGSRIGIMEIYKKALAVLAKKPLVLWGISLLSGVIAFAFNMLFGLVAGVGVCLSLLLSVGMTMVYLHGYRGEEVHTVQLFDAFKDGATIKRTLGGMAWMYMWILVWGLIPIAGPILMIIRSYQYRLTPYILVTEPDVNATEAIEVSKKRTEGWKGKMFGADLLIHVIIGVIMLVLALLGKIPYIGVLFSIIMVLFGIAVALFFNLFMGLVQAAFYEEINASLK
ncbi:MAG: zinc-ribbon domain-containing protein [Eubacteriales bacterium]|nr:zinc-ribbon domain-containing protein [Eubacteriales bacterium]